jgi:hypothetical protein
MVEYKSGGEAQPRRLAQPVAQLDRGERVKSKLKELALRLYCRW